MAKQQTTEQANAADTQSNKAFNSRLQECPIAIVGIASIFAGASNLEQYWDNIVESVNAITDVPKNQWSVEDYYHSDPKVADKTYCKRGGFLPEIDFDPMEFGLPPNILELTDIAQLLSLVVARDVLNDAGIGDGSGYDRDKVGITLGIGGGQKQIGPLTSRLQGPVLDKVLKASGVDAEDRAMIIEKFKKAYIGWEENSFPGMLGNVIAGRIANRFDFGGTNCVVDAACASSLSAIKLAVSDLLEYRSEVMISGGVCCDNSPFMYMSFSKTPAFTTNDDIRPFDVDSKGMMIGEGIGMMAFKRLEDAERDGDKIYAVLKGIGSSSDGRFKSIYAPRPDGQAKALKRAYDDAGFEPKTCGLIEAHGTGTKAGDAAEFKGLVKHFGANNQATQHIALGSVKSQIGHAKAAAGAAGMIKAVLALHHKVLPATINVDTPNPVLDIENSPLYINSETRPWMPREDGIPRRAGISSFGFGGTNFHMVLEEYQTNAQGKYRLNAVPASILFSAKTPESLAKLLAKWQTKLNVNVADKVFTFNTLVTEHPVKKLAVDDARCGFVADNAEQALALITSAIKQLASSADAPSNSWQMPSGIYYRPCGIEAAGKVVALFSGQGSQYLNMGRELVCNFPCMMQAASNMDSQFTSQGLTQLSQVSYPIPAFTSEDKKRQEQVLRLTQHAQPAIGSFSLGLYKTFSQAGFSADFTAGHSFGELTALWAAGVLSEQDYMMLARTRGQAMAAPVANSSSDESEFQPHDDPGTMIAVVGDIAEIETMIERISDVVIANYNSNNQVVVAGSTAQVALASETLTAQGFKVVALPVSAAFHTPLVAHAQAPFAEAIEGVTFNKPEVPVYANGTGKVHSSEPEAIKKSLKQHMLGAVHFTKEIENIFAAGGRVFVEFGPKNVLTKLVDNILAKQDDVVTIAINNNAKQCSDKQLRQAAMQLAVLGVNLNDIDPHNAIERPLVAKKMSPLAMKLTGKSYVSEKTEKAFADALADGRLIKQAKAADADFNPTMAEKVVEKVVEVERVVEVEKIVYLNTQGQPVNKQGQLLSDEDNNHRSSQQGVPPTGELSSASAIEQSVNQFVAHQQQVLALHEQFMQGPKAYANTVTSVLNSLPQAQANQNIPASVERTLKQYHDFQAQTLRVHEQYLTNQTDSMANMLPSHNGSAVSAFIANTKANQPAPLQVESRIEGVNLTQQPNSKQSEHSASSVNQSLFSQQLTNQPLVSQNKVSEVETDKAHSEVFDEAFEEVLPSNNHQTATSELSTLSNIENAMLAVVADKTGYPSEMLSLDMDMEADLGIDSIKRVEILGAVQDEITDLPELNPEDLAELRTLGEIVSYMQANAPASSSTMAPAVSIVESMVESDAAKPSQTLGQSSAVNATIDLNHIENVMMTVVADKTGYPSEMLSLEMDMEADLGIDSIKRVEILGAVQDQITDLPELNPEDLAELRTLGEIVSYMQANAPAASSTSASTTSPLAPQADQVSDVSSAANATNTNNTPIDLNHIENVMMTVVADKTGYPSEMLSLEMDMEADLGIDSIKRVEILGAVQDEITDLPELNPEDLAELRTLGEIVNYMQANAPVPAITPAPTASTLVPQAEQASDVTSTSNTSVDSKTSIDLTQIETVMMTVVADKTGYPSEMLSLEMDMEADLGIDSIKRVEILGAVQDQITDLPELNPEDLAELRTLGAIIAYMHEKLAGEQVIADNDEIEPFILNKTLTTLDADTKINDAATMDTSKHAPSAVVTLQRLPQVTKIAKNLSELNTKNTQKTAVLLVDDGTNTAVLLSHKLLASDCTVTVLQPNWQPCNKAADFTTEVKLITLGSEEQTLDEVELETLLTDHCPLDMVIYLQANQTAAGINFSHTAKQGIMLAFLLAKHCKLTPTNNERSAFVVVTRQGGTLGYIQPSMTINSPLTAQPDLVQGGLAGLVKTFAHECRASVNANHNSHHSDLDASAEVFCRLIDFSSNLHAENAVNLILDELLDSNTSLIEVGYDTDNTRNDLNSDSNHRLTLVAKPTNSYTLDQKQQAEGINAHSVFVVSGGAKGVTAHCVIELAKQYQATFILLGRSPLLINKGANHSINAADNKVDKNQQLNSQGLEPSWADGLDDEATLKKAAMQVLIASGEKPTPVKVNEFVSPIIANREIVATLDAIKQAGGKAYYVACDVCDSDNVEQGVTLALDYLSKQTQTRLSITGIIHGAGVLADKHITQKTTAEFSKVYDTKIQGLSALLSICSASQLKHLVLFSSAAGFYGNAGQADYAVANEILNKTAYRFKTLYPGTQVLSFNWGPWDGGMVTAALKRMFNERGTYIIPLDAGAKLLASELNANNNRCPQILVGNDLSAPSEKASHSVKVIIDDEPETRAIEHEVSAGIENSEDSEGREKAIEGAEVKKLVVSRLSARVVKTLQTTNNIFLADHSIGEQQVLPTVCAHSWMREAVGKTYPEFVVQGITDYKLFKGITFNNIHSRNNKNNNSVNNPSKVDDNQYVIDMKVAELNRTDHALSKSTINMIDGNTVLVVNAKISSVNALGNTVFHYQASVCLSLTKEALAATKLSSQLTRVLATPLTSKMVNEAAELYQNGTLFHGQSLQGISHLVACDDQGLVLACQVPEIAAEKQGDFTMSTDNIFANDLVYQAMLVWTQKILGLGSLPSTTQSWHTFANVQRGQIFYVSLVVVKAPVKNAKLKNATVVADVSLIDQQGQHLAVINGVEVTASENLQDLFLASSAVRSQQLKPNTLLPAD